MAIEGTPLYNALAERWGHNPSWPMILNDLNRLDDGHFVEVDKDATTINNAFTWETTPQGHHYWSTIDLIDRSLRAGGDVRGMQVAKPKGVVKYAAEYH